jgi:RNA polymerase sigma factor (sigma-70 family)
VNRSALLDDEQLFTAACGGDAEAFGVLYSRYFGKAAAKCAIVAGADASAEDLAQDVFAEAWARIRDGRVSARGEFGAWLLGAIAPYVITCRRHQWWEQRAVVEQSAELARRDHQHGASAPLADPDEVTGMLAEQLAALPPRHRLSVQLCLLDGRRTRVAAEMLGLSRKTLTNYKVAALAALRARMAPAGAAVAA